MQVKFQIDHKVSMTSVQSECYLHVSNLKCETRGSNAIFWRPIGGVVCEPIGIKK